MSSRATTLVLPTYSLPTKTRNPNRYRPADGYTQTACPGASITWGTSCNLYSRHADRWTRSSLVEIHTTLVNIVGSYPKVYIIIDALDECRHNRSELLTILCSLQTKTNARLMVTSCFIIWIEQSFQGRPKLEIRASDVDVKRLIESQMHRLPNRVQSDLGLQIETKEAIVQAVDGM